jgi:hypothetical protein
MEHLMKREDREINKGPGTKEKDRIREYRERIADDSYLEHAINRIATDLSHYLTR